MKDNMTDAGKPGASGRYRRYLVNTALVLGALLIWEGLSFVVFKLAGYTPYQTPLIENPHHPYLGWIAAPNLTVHARNCGGTETLIETDADGYSITPRYGFENPELTLVITGGSTMFGVGSATNATTVSAFLEKLIVEELGVKAEVHNIAVRGYQSFQEMLALLRYSTEYDFDLAIAISGRNDSYHAAQEQSRQAGLLEVNPHRASEFVRRAERNEFILTGALSALRSCCYSVDLLANIAGIDDNTGRANTPGRLRSSQRHKETHNFSDVQQRAEISLINYALMDQIARERGAEFIMVLQPTLYTRATPAPSETACSGANQSNPFGLFDKEFEGRFYQAFLDQHKSFDFIDARTALDSGTSEDVYYVDKAHYNDRGAELLARYVFDQIRPRIEAIVARRRAGLDTTRRSWTLERSGAVIHGEDLLAGRTKTPSAAVDQ